MDVEKVQRQINEVAQKLIHATSPEMTGGLARD